MAFKPTHGHTVAKYHGGSPSPEYNSWVGMIQRCTNPNSPNWCYYGAKGVSVCDRWRSFENFLADMGDRPLGTSLDRFPDKNGNYEPSNCRWATPKQQVDNRNRPKKRKLYTFKGETHTLIDWGIKLGGGKNYIVNRVHRGMSFEQAITTPPARRLSCQ